MFRIRIVHALLIVFVLSATAIFCWVSRYAAPDYETEIHRFRVFPKHKWYPYPTGVSTDPHYQKNFKQVSHTVHNSSVAPGHKHIPQTVRNARFFPNFDPAPGKDYFPDYPEQHDIDVAQLAESDWKIEPTNQTFEPTLRSSRGKLRLAPTKFKSRVACWPSTGGVWIKHADLIELNFLGVSWYRDVPRQFNQTAEDEFCMKLRMTGAKWWNLPSQSKPKRKDEVDIDQPPCNTTLEECVIPDWQPDVLIGWGTLEHEVVVDYGITALETLRFMCYVPNAKLEVVGTKNLNGHLEGQTMIDRCYTILEVFGGKWCMCKKDCPDLLGLDWGAADDEHCDLEYPLSSYASAIPIQILQDGLEGSDGWYM